MHVHVDAAIRTLSVREQ